MKNLYCSFVGHRYIVSKCVTDHVKEYQCVHCALSMTTDGKGKLTKLTPKFKEINEILEQVYTKRRRKKLKDEKFEVAS